MELKFYTVTFFCCWSRFFFLSVSRACFCHSFLFWSVARAWFCHSLVIKITVYKITTVALYLALSAWFSLSLNSYEQSGSSYFLFTFRRTWSWLDVNFSLFFIFILVPFSLRVFQFIFHFVWILFGVYFLFYICWYHCLIDWYLSKRLGVYTCARRGWTSNQTIFILICRSFV